MDVSDPSTLEERRANASEFRKRLGYDIPIYVDDMDDKIGQMYAARPSRLYLVGRDGTVIHVGDVGQIDLNPENFKSAIKKYLEQ